MIAKIQGKQTFIASNHTSIYLVWKWFTLGILGLAVLFLFTVLWNVPPQQLFTALLEELNDPDHDNTAFAANTKQYFINIAESNDFFIPMLITILIMIAVSLYKPKAIWLGIVCLATTLYLRRFMQEQAYIIYLMFLSFLYPKTAKYVG
jgi:hypothetical protein